MAKIKASKIVFGNVAGVKDYQRAEKLQKKYERAKERGRDKDIRKARAELNDAIKEATEGLKRLQKIYGDSIEAMGTGEEVEPYKKDANSFLDEIKKYMQNLETWSEGELKVEEGKEEEKPQKKNGFSYSSSYSVTPKKGK